MGAQKVTTSPEGHQEMSLLAKAWRATKDFVKGTIYALPMTAISSGAALGLSLLVSYMTGGVHDPLGVSDKFLPRWIGSSIIFGLVGGGMKAYEGWNKPEETESKEQSTPMQRTKEQVVAAKGKEHEFAPAPYTPPIEREARARQFNV